MSQLSATYGKPKLWAQLLLIQVALRQIVGKNEEERAFVGEIHTFCNRMLNLPVSNKPQGVARQAHGHGTFGRQEEDASRTSEEKGVACIHSIQVQF
jgi:hypothetical protein